MFFSRSKPAPLPQNLQNRSALPEQDVLPTSFCPGDANTNIAELFRPNNYAVLRALFYRACAEFSAENVIAAAAILGYKKAPSFTRTQYIAGMLLADTNTDPGTRSRINASLQQGRQPGGRGRVPQVQSVAPDLFDTILGQLTGNLLDTLSRCHVRENNGVHFYAVQVRGAEVPKAVQKLQTMSRMGILIPQVLLTA